MDGVLSGHSHSYLLRKPYSLAKSSSISELKDPYMSGRTAIRIYRAEHQNPTICKIVGSELLWTTGVFGYITLNIDMRQFSPKSRQNHHTMTGRCPSAPKFKLTNAIQRQQNHDITPSKSKNTIDAFTTLKHPFVKPYNYKTLTASSMTPYKP